VSVKNERIRQQDDCCKLYGRVVYECIIIDIALIASCVRCSVFVTEDQGSCALSR
jgi:hypothetical protein